MTLPCSVRWLQNTARQTNWPTDGSDHKKAKRQVSERQRQSVTSDEWKLSVEEKKERVWWAEEDQQRSGRNRNSHVSWVFSDKSSALLVCFPSWYLLTNSTKECFSCSDVHSKLRKSIKGDEKTDLHHKTRGNRAPAQTFCSTKHQASFIGYVGPEGCFNSTWAVLECPHPIAASVKAATGLCGGWWELFYIINNQYLWLHIRVTPEATDDRVSVSVPWLAVV